MVGVMEHRLGLPRRQIAMTSASVTRCVTMHLDLLLASQPANALPTEPGPRDDPRIAEPDQIALRADELSGS